MNVWLLWKIRAPAFSGQTAPLASSSARGAPPPKRERPALRCLRQRREPVQPSPKSGSPSEPRWRSASASALCAPPNRSCATTSFRPVQ